MRAGWPGKRGSAPASLPGQPLPPRCGWHSARRPPGRPWRSWSATAANGTATARSSTSSLALDRVVSLTRNRLTDRALRQRSEALRLSAMSDRPLRGTRLLLVEDDAGIRATLGELLADEGLVVTTAANGRLALHELRTAAPPDVIVLDLMMPVMDGWEFRVEQRGDPALADIPLVAMSADLSAKARAIAADGYVRKPIDFPGLLR